MKSKRQPNPAQQFTISTKSSATISGAIKQLHGIGLKSVREIIEKHDGIFNITQNNEWFTVEIMLLKSAAV